MTFSSPDVRYCSYCDTRGEARVARNPLDLVFRLPRKCFNVPYKQVADSRGDPD